MEIIKASKMAFLMAHKIIPLAAMLGFAKPTRVANMESRIWNRHGFFILVIACISLLKWQWRDKQGLKIEEGESRLA